MLILASATSLVLELGPNLVHKLAQAVARCGRHHPTMGVVHCHRRRLRSASGAHRPDEAGAVPKQVPDKELVELRIWLRTETRQETRQDSRGDAGWNWWWCWKTANNDR